MIRYERFCPPNPDLILSHVLDLDNRFTDVTLALREGIEDAAFFHIPPSTREMKGIHGLRVYGVRLTKYELESLKIADEVLDLIADYLFIDPPIQHPYGISGNADDVEITLSLICQGDRRTSDDWNVNRYDYLWKVQRSIFNSRSIKRHFVNAVRQYPKKPVLFIVGHGHTPDQSAKYIGDRHANYSYDQLEYLLEQLDMQDFAAIIDGTCNDKGYIPTLPAHYPPYFATLGNLWLRKQNVICIKNGVPMIRKPE